MPQVRPFHGLGYALDRFGSAETPERVRLAAESADHPGRRIADLSEVACPPYDVIGPEQQAALLARDDFARSLDPADRAYLVAARAAEMARRDRELRA